MVKKIMLRLAYDGTNYCGFQKQPSGCAVQDALNKTIEKLTGEEIISTASSRTDSGVHSLDNIVVFETNSTIPPIRWSYVLNSYLPMDIRVISSSEVSKNFHPLREKFIKTYQYRILNSKKADPLRRNFTWNVTYELDVSAMKAAAKLFIGEHDFKAFRVGKRKYKTTIRNMYSSEIEVKGDELLYTVSGNGFMYNMVRIIMGTLVDVGLGEVNYDDIIHMLDSGELKKRGDTAPPQGLVLVKTELEDKSKLLY